MAKYIFTYIIGDSKPSKDVDRLKSFWPEILILDESSPRRMLVEAPAESIAAITAALPGWRITPNRTLKPAVTHPDGLGPWPGRGPG